MRPRVSPADPVPVVYVVRPCLRCDRSFRSEGAHNRICGQCTLDIDRYAWDQAYGEDGDCGRRCS